MSSQSLILNVLNEKQKEKKHIPLAEKQITLTQLQQTKARIQIPLLIAQLQIFGRSTMDEKLFLFLCSNPSVSYRIMSRCLSTSWRSVVAADAAAGRWHETSK